ncbi:MAG: hypothetical protein AVO39_11050 [delta proteobacterium MLS_D]|nr:MAG: hypothetical protein AVO39_11050 [delta proteobacterium MLS_D]
MTLTPTPVMDAHVLIQIELDGLTLYYADQHLSMSNGQFYEGRLLISTLQRAFSSFTAPKQRASTLTITLEDADLTIRGLLQDYTWGNRNVFVYVGVGRDIADYTIDFHGVIKFPGGIGFDRTEVRIELRDARNKDKVDLPENKYWVTNYPNLEDGAEGTPIPIVYGDWSFLVHVPIPVTCIDTTTNQFKIADHAIQDIVQVYKNDEEVSHSNEDLDEATFTISSYDPQNDEVTAVVKGKVSGGLIENPSLVLRDIQLNYIGISTDNIDGDSYDQLAMDLADFKCRRYIADEISTDTLIEELAIENLFDLYIHDDKYTVKNRIPQVNIDRTFDDTTIISGSLQVESDPEGLYANRIKCNYAYDPVADTWQSFAQEDNEAIQDDVLQVISRTIDFNWLYEESNVRALAAHLIILYSRAIDVIKFTALGDGILTQLSDRIGLTYAHYTNRPLLVREISKHFRDMSCTIYGYDSIQHILPGYWVDDDAPDYSSATADERAKQGFWTDDDGLADPEDETSKQSVWW